LAVVRATTAAVEKLLRRIYADALADRSADERSAAESSVALVAVGGFGRRELCPYSDVDLLILHDGGAAAPVEPFIAEFVRGVWDAGLSLGQNVGPPKALAALAKKEILPATSFLDARFLFGAQRLFDDFHQRFRKLLSGGGGVDLFLRALAAVQAEQRKFGATVHLLEPNVKRSAGGLRDVHLIRWAASAVHHTTDLAELEAQGALGAGDAATLAAALSFLLRLRCNLHFHAGNAHDDLLRMDQLRIAQEWGYEDAPGRLGVELFMADYFRTSTDVADALERFVERTRPRSLTANAREFFLARRAADGVSIGVDRLVVSAKVRREAALSLERTIELAELAARRRVRFDVRLTEALRRRHRIPQNAAGDETAPSEEAIARFRRFLSCPGTQAQILRALHRTAVLSRVIPEFEHVRCLLQFNAYHKYTVDEHTFVVVENLESFADRQDVLGRAYRAVEAKDVLHLAALLHDLGKGRRENHSDVGRRIAQDYADRWKLSPPERDALVFLVHRHLLLSDLAMKRDTSDPKVWIALAKEVGDAQRLKMLYALTAADVMGVGPGVYSRWTAELLEDLYRNTLAVLGETEDAASSLSRCEARRRELLAKHPPGSPVQRIIEGLPSSYLAEVDADAVDRHLQAAAALSNGDVEVLSAFRPESQAATYTVITSERASESVFSKICGGLAAHHMDVLRARIYTLADGTVIDQFDVRDAHSFGDPSPERVQKVAATIRRILKGELSVLDALYSTRSSLFAAAAAVQRPVDTRVSIDNTISETASVVDVFTNNRRGLLYTLAKAIAELNLSVHYAKIATYEDEAADVFYVREMDGSKIQSPDRIQEVEERLADAVRRLAENPRSMGF
jgi:[protein-PII] uridylyltransferase